VTANAVTEDAATDAEGLPANAGAEIRLEPLADAEAKEKTEDILEALRDVLDPELGINVVDLGLVYGILPERDTQSGSLHATLDMTLTSAACPLTDVIEEQAAEALKDTVENFTINWVWMPPWGPESITDDGREQLRALGFSI
jgi:metal-sulfur cluster biosynthetic enzyme